MSRGWEGRAIPCTATRDANGLSHDWRPDRYNEEWRMCRECGAKQRIPDAPFGKSIGDMPMSMGKSVAPGPPGPKGPVGCVGAQYEAERKRIAKLEGRAQDADALENAITELAELIECDEEDVFGAVPFMIDRAQTKTLELRARVTELEDELSGALEKRQILAFKLRVAYGVASLVGAAAVIGLVKFSLYLF